MDGYLIVLIIFLAWIAVLIVGQKFKFWEKIHCQLMGPFLMVKTVKGRQLIDRLARRKRFWTAYGRISVIVSIGSMIALTLVLAWEATVVLSIPRQYAPTPEMMLGIPGLNPLIPIWYGILGIAVAIIIHEFAHGILSRVADIKVESLGLVFLVIPMGAFVEPNEEEIRKTERKNRVRLFAAGPGTNMLAAFICFLVLILVLSPAIKPVSQGAIVNGVVIDSPAERFGISRWSEIMSIDGDRISDAEGITALTFYHPGAPVDVEILYDGNTSTVQVPGGIVIQSVTLGSPADKAGIKPGMIIESLNNEMINGMEEFTSVIQNSTHDAPVGITVLTYGYDATLGKNWFVVNQTVTTITLIDKWDYYQQNMPNANNESYKGLSYMGVGSSVLGVAPVDSDYVSRYYSISYSNDVLTSSINFISFPLRSLSPIEGPLSTLYEPSGLLSGMPSGIFWLLTNSIYWIFWINLMVGLTNALPAVPLDGGYVFRDMLKGLFDRVNAKRQSAAEAVRKKLIAEADADRIISFISLIISVFILFLIMWQLIGPKLF